MCGWDAQACTSSLVLEMRCDAIVTANVQTDSATRCLTGAPVVQHSRVAVCERIRERQARGTWHREWIHTTHRTTLVYCEVSWQECQVSGNSVYCSGPVSIKYCVWYIQAFHLNMRFSWRRNTYCTPYRTVVCSQSFSSVVRHRIIRSISGQPPDGQHIVKNCVPCDPVAQATIHHHHTSNQNPNLKAVTIWHN